MFACSGNTNVYIPFFRVSKSRTRTLEFILTTCLGTRPGGLISALSNV